MTLRGSCISSFGNGEACGIDSFSTARQMRKDAERPCPEMGQGQIPIELSEALSVLAIPRTTVLLLVVLAVPTVAEAALVTPLALLAVPGFTYVSDTMV